VGIGTFIRRNKKRLSMAVKETIGAGVVATSMMTAFSYAVSAVERENFKEPQLLSVFLERMTAVHHPLIKVSGWPAHYTLGCVWAGVYTFWAEQLQHKISFKQALRFGLFSGTVGVIIWRAMFRHLPHPPKTDRVKFYRQLFIAHIVFGLSLAKSYAALTREERDDRRQQEIRA
jgi:hypothetical protein